MLQIRMEIAILQIRTIIVRHKCGLWSTFTYLLLALLLNSDGNCSTFNYWTVGPNFSHKYWSQM